MGSGRAGEGHVESVLHVGFQAAGGGLWVWGLWSPFLEQPWAGDRDTRARLPGCPCCQSLSAERGCCGTSDPSALGPPPSPLLKHPGPPCPARPRIPLWSQGTLWGQCPSTPHPRSILPRPPALSGAGMPRILIWALPASRGDFLARARLAGVRRPSDLREKPGRLEHWGHLCQTAKHCHPHGVSLPAKPDLAKLEPSPDPPALPWGPLGGSCRDKAGSGGPRMGWWPSPRRTCLRGLF